MAQQAWQGGLWDRPRSGARYCVQRPDARHWGGMAVALDQRGGVLTFGDRAAANQHASRLNQGTGAGWGGGEHDTEGGRISAERK